MILKKSLRPAARVHGRWIRVGGENIEASTATQDLVDC
jgi:hypothetical protein